MPATKGIHHVTSISGSAQGNVDFYVGSLGLRLVKRTVNFDDPGTWHLYYGDHTGSPGSLITFFPWQGIQAGVRGSGEVAATSYATTQKRLQEWATRLGIPAATIERFGEPVLELRDSDGGWLELVGTERSSEGGRWISGFHGVTLAVERPQATAKLLTGILGFEEIGEEDGRLRLSASGGAGGEIVDLVSPSGSSPARLGSGSVHHVAFRAEDDEQQAEFRDQLLHAGFEVTPVRDRQYFRSIYFREPGGVLFEIATDPPGMLIDETVESLGSELQLPPWYEPARDRIEATLPPIELPDPAKAAAVEEVSE